MQNKEIMVSVIIPVYNTEKYVDEMLASIREQTLKDIEIICVNDGSTDGSLDILQEHAAQDERIVVLSQENRGVSAARNCGFDRAVGKYVYYFDSDDILKPDALEVLCAEAEQGSLDLLLFDADVIYENEELRETFQGGENYYKKDAAITQICSGPELAVQLVERKAYRDPVYLMLLRREFLLKYGIRFYEGIIHEDVPFTFLCVMQAERAKKLDHAFLWCRMREGSIVTTPVGVRNLLGYLDGLDGMISFSRSRQWAPEVLDAQVAIFEGVFKSATYIYGKLSDVEKKALMPLNALERAMLSLMGECARLDAQVEELVDWANKLTEAREFLEQQIVHKDTRIAELENWAGDLEKAKKYFLDEIAQRDAEIRILQGPKVSLPFQNEDGFRHIVSLGYNCEVSFRIEDYLHNKIDSYPLSWAYMLNQEELVHILTNLNLLASEQEFQYVKESGMFHCKSLNINVHTSVDKTKVARFNKERFEKFVETASKEMRERFAYLCSKWNALLEGDDSTLFVLKLQGWLGEEKCKKIAVQTSEWLRAHYKSGKFLLVCFTDNDDIFKSICRELSDREYANLTISKVGSFAEDSNTHDGGDIASWIKGIELWNHIADASMTEVKEEFVQQITSKDAHIAELEGWNRDVEAAKEYLEQQIVHKDTRIAELESWAKELESARDFLKERWESAELLCEQQQQTINKQDELLAEKENTIAKQKYKLKLLLSDPAVQKIIAKKHYEI